MQICPIVHKILTNKNFTVVDDLISQLFVVTFVHSTYVQIEKTIGFTERMKKIQKKAEVALRKAQKEMKQQTNRKRKEIKEWIKDNKIMLSMKNLVFKERLVKKLVN